MNFDRIYDICDKINLITITHILQYPNRHLLTHITFY